MSGTQMATSGNIRGAVIGVGYLGRFHAQKYKALEGVELIGVSDASPERAAEIATELGVRSFRDFKELKGQVDAVTIAASTKAHFEVAKFFLESGVHVNVEKPMTVTIAEAEELVSLARTKGLKLQVGHVERFNPAFRLALDKIKSPQVIDCQRLAPFKPRGVDVDVVLDLMIHDIDIALAIAKSPVANVTAAGSIICTQQADVATARLEFESGAVANITCSRVATAAVRKTTVFQKDEFVTIDFGTGGVTRSSRAGDWQKGETPLATESWMAEKGDALLSETQAFLHAVRTGASVVVPGEDGLNAMRIAEKVQKEIYSRLQRAK